MTMGLYLVRRLAISFALIGSVFFGMLMLFETVEMVRRFGGGDTPMSEIVWLALLRVPATFYQILPLLMILASMAMFLGLARSSELVVIRSAGRSAMRMLREPFIATLLFGAVLVAFFNPVVAGASRAYQSRLAAMHAPDQLAQISLEGSALWMRQGDEIGQTVIRAQGVEPDGLGFHDVTFLIFERDSGLPLVRIEAAGARLLPGRWLLTDAKRWDLMADNPERDARTFLSLELQSDLTGERIRESFAATGTMSVWDLPEFIRALDRAGLSSRPHQAQFQAELALPMLMAAMLMVGAVLCFRHTRAGGAGSRILTTVLAGFALFFLRNFAQVLGENGQIPLALAIWTPPIASMLLALGVLLHLEDG
ncbi:LPS export ABC transporter permease LptG [Pararhodobacter sp. CCB-MM2]|uniref:LPS export ABC transporter permease LptG n=1 Tax=Pararhodobacter sp. CCB-MM2 TaxID=1786003 RepID=UPI0008335FF8|nr:LPS export ABC transporter permease LptG [Pararhodobacter sp. CCB-MM2]MCA2011047.1 LPS export ABC transporter permease LptG [Cereibacter sphaeroides]